MRNALFLFGQLTDEDVDDLTRSGRREQLPRGQAVIRAGRAIDSVYVVLEGHFVVSRPDGQVIARIGPGEVLGEMSFVDASLPSADVEAETDAIVLRVPRERLAARLTTDGGFAARFFRAVAMMLSDRLRATTRGFGGPVPEGVLEPDELDPNVLEQVNRAGERFDRMLRATRG